MITRSISVRIRSYFNRLKPFGGRRKVAKYVVPEPVKLESVPPPVTVTSSDVKSLVDSLNVNVKLMLASFEVKPLSPSADVIVIVGDVVS